jgi:hypothetical protein
VKYEEFIKKNKFVFCSFILLNVFIVLAAFKPLGGVPEPTYPTVTTDEGTYNLAEYSHLTSQQIGWSNYFRELAFNQDLDEFEGLTPKLGDQLLSMGPGSDGGLRYVLAFTSYALSEFALKTPAYRYYYQEMLDRYLQKMQTKPVMAYWNDSTAWFEGNVPWAYNGRSYYQFTVDTFGVPPGDYYGLNYTNIMYRGHWLLMMTMYNYLFNDTKYNANMTWQLDGLYDEMMNPLNPVQQHHKIPGVPCEPSFLFSQCNSVQRLAFSIYDNSLSNASNPTTYNNASKALVEWEMNKGLNSKGLFLNGIDVVKYNLSQVPYYKNLYNLDENSHIMDDDSGYGNSWTIMFMRGYNKSMADHMYPTFKRHHVVDRQLYSGIMGNIAFLKEDSDMDPFTTDLFQFAFSFVASGFGMFAAHEFGDLELRDRLVNFFDKFLPSGWTDNKYSYSAPLLEGLAFVANLGLFWSSLDDVSLADFTVRRPTTFFNQPYISKVSDPARIFINQAVYDEPKTAFILTTTVLNPGSITISNLNSSSKVFSSNPSYDDWTLVGGNLTLNVNPGTYNFVIEDR